MEVEKCGGKFFKKFAYDVQQSNEMASGRYGVKGGFFFFNKRWETLGHVHLWMELMQYI